MTRPAFLLINRNKAKWVAQAVRGALSQTVPCLVMISDQGSTDGSMDIIRNTVSDYGATHHDVRVVECPITGAYGMRACNQHLQWCIEQMPADVDWIFQCSSDDYSLPNRVKSCLGYATSGMDATATIKAVGICNAMYFAEPGEESPKASTGWPGISGFIPAGDGLVNLAYGSSIWAYRREWLLKVGLLVDCTLDVYLGFLAALDGLYYVDNPQHVHVQHASVENMGFQGKLAAATGDESLILNELNQLQLMSLYFSCAKRAQELHPEGVSAEAMNACVQMIVNHADGLLQTRMILNAKGMQPGILK